MDKAIDLASHGIRHGFNVGVRHNTDSSGSPYIMVAGAKGEQHTFRATWHTRDTGTYRLFTCLAEERETSLAELREYIEATP